MDDDKLIAAVRNRLFLWDKSDINHFNRGMIAAAWTNIAKEVGGGVTAADCKTRWTSLRDYFVRKHKEMRTTTSGPTARKRKKWHLYEFMLFLVPTIATGFTSTDLPDVDEDSNSSGCSDIEQSQVSMPTSPLSIQSDESLVSAKRMPGQCQKRKAAKKTEISAVDREILKALRDPEKQQVDENEMFFKSLLPSLKKLDEVETMQFRLEVQQLAINYLQRARAKTATAASPLGSPQASSASSAAPTT